MIDYKEVRKGDILKVSEDGAGAPGYAAYGELLRVTEVFENGVTVEDKNGSRASFYYNCGAARLEPTEWRDDFPFPTKEGDQ